MHESTNQDNCLYQASTLQALMLGYFRKVTTVGEFLKHGNSGVGTFEDLDGEMIVIDGHCYRAAYDGKIYEVDKDTCIPFGNVGYLKGSRSWDWDEIESFSALSDALNNKIEEHFGLNSMHIVRIDGEFDFVDARSVPPLRKTQHITLEKLVAEKQSCFHFENMKGSLICVYFPNYMDGINLPGWHIHFIDEARKVGGHVFGMKIKSCHVRMDKVSRLEIQLPIDPQFDTYDLKEATAEGAKALEEGKK